ncbi:MAG: DUF2934 domain-containing protein [Candidatus Didemnitutus sp.]|nr:DUF2934 domain-containing protein [Candidatus Didemnitutus sp.]
MKIRENRQRREQRGHAIIGEPMDEIRHEAYLLWLQEGCPEGREVEHWLAAKEIVRHRLTHPKPNGDVEMELRPTDRLVEQL